MNKVLFLGVLLFSILTNGQNITTKYSAHLYSSPFYSWEKQKLGNPEKLEFVDEGVVVKALSFYLLGDDREYVGDVKVEFGGKVGWMSSLNFDTQELRKIPLMNKKEILARTNAKVLQMTKDYGGTFSIACKVNDLPLKFIVDTGASDVSISLTEALFMLKNGYLSKSDFIGTEYYSIANGEIKEGTTINIKKLEFGEFTLYNVKASISHELKAPLLLGQSALSKLGKITINYNAATLTVE